MNKEIKYIVDRVYQYAKINLSEKETLVRSRLTKRLRQLGFKDFKEYVDYLKKEDLDHEEFKKVVDIVSTNYSYFFREGHHFEFLKEKILPKYVDKEINIWSAASSKGQEIYSILMTILDFEESKGIKLKCNLFASDISSEVLKHASKGVYDMEEIVSIPKKYIKKHLLKGDNQHLGSFKIKNKYINKIKFFKVNLNSNSYNLPPMDVVFLRNAIIYFDKETKIEIINNIRKHLKPKGYLFLGHSESLMGISDSFDSLHNTIYRLKDV